MPTLKQALKAKLSEQELSILPNSFDIIGSIAIFTNFPKALIKKEKLIAKELLSANHNLLTIARKTENYSGKYRLQKIKIIAGKKTKEALHKENGIILKLNVETCYFSPRTAGERLRIASLVKPQESVLVLFSGIAAFPIVISRNSHSKEVYCIEINPLAHKYALENIRLNKITNITALKGDVKTILPKLKKKFDRILMPLPKNAEDYLGIALKFLNPQGIIHFYDFSQEKDFPGSSLAKIKKHCRKFKILNKVICGNYAPFTKRVCIDFQPL